MTNRCRRPSDGIVATYLGELGLRRLGGDGQVSDLAARLGRLECKPGEVGLAVVSRPDWVPGSLVEELGIESCTCGGRAGCAVEGVGPTLMGGDLRNKPLSSGVLGRH